MGNTVDGATKIVYRTKDNIKIEYIYYDLKGKNRFPPLPQDQQQIQSMFQKTLKEINISSQQLQILQEFNLKYRYRFVVLHDRRVQQYRQKNELNTFRNSKTSEVHQTKNMEKNISNKLDQKLKLLENNEAAVKMQLGSIQKLVSAQNKYVQFIKIDGVSRLIHILDNAIQANKKGTKTIFQNQIQILKFLKYLSNRIPKQYFSAVAKIRNYGLVLLRAYHPINIAVTAYVLLLLEDYSWKVQNSLSLMQCLKQFKQENKISSFLQPFTSTIYHTNNILMCYYNLRFINQMIISIVNQKEKRIFQQELKQLRFELILEDVKSKLQQNYFKMEYCTFIAVSQAIYKNATRNKKDKDNIHQNLNRSNVKLQTLQHSLLVKIASDYKLKNETVAQYDQQEEDDDDRRTPVYLAENDKKCFNKFILDTISQLQNYGQLTIIVDEGVKSITSQENKQEIKNEKNGLSIQQCLKRIKGNYLKNSCEQVVLNCFKAFQLFQKNEWKKLQNFINEDLKTQYNIHQIQNLKKQINQKQIQLQNIKKQFKQYKIEMLNRLQYQNGSLINNTNKKKYQSPNQNFKGLAKLPRPPTDFTVLPNSSVLSNKIKAVKVQSVQSTYITNSLPPSIPTLPKITERLINLPSQTNNISKLVVPPSIGIPLLPPPPNLNDFPLPPQLPSLPPPPSGFSNLLPLPPLVNLPFPPLGLPNIPAPPSLNGLSTLTLPGIIQQKKKSKKQPKVNLKACNYIVLSYQKIKQTVWEKLDDSKITLDQSQIESLFTKPNPKKQNINEAQSTNLISDGKKEKIKLLAPDKHRNFQIVLTKLKIPENGIIQALTQCSGKYVIPSILDSLIKILPSQEDQMRVKDYDGNIDDLSLPQKFIKEIISVPQYANRIQTLIFANHREQIYQELQSKIQSLTTAFDSLKANYRLHYILQVALALGNYLNGTGIKGGAWGFRLDTIQNMQQVTSNDNKMNAGFYMIKQVWKKYSYPIFDKQEIEMYQHVQKMPTSQVKSDLVELKNTINTIDKAFNSKMIEVQNDRIDEHCEQLLIQAKQKYSMLQHGVREMERAYSQCATFYCQNPNKAPSDEIGKKIFKCVLFIFNTQKVFYQIEEKRKKEESRKAPKIQMKFIQKVPINNSNPQSNKKTLNKSQSILIDTTVPVSQPNNSAEVIAQEKVKELEKSQKDKEKKFLQEMMKKRSNKMMAFRQSRLPNVIRSDQRLQQQTDLVMGQ